jgi:hypothetical protein
VVTVAQGASKIVTIQVVDSNGNALPATVSAAAASADITVTPDTGFQPVFGADNVAHANTVNDQYRVSVTGNNLAASTITVTSGSLTYTIPVIVTPTELSVTPSAVSELGLITLTAPAGLTFGDPANVTITKSATDTATVGFAIASTGSTLSFLPFQGLTDQAFAVRGVIPSYAPSLLLSLNATSKLTTTAPNSDITTAPTLPIPATGASYTVYGIPPFGWSGCAGDLGDNCNVYKVVTTVANTKIHVELDWDNGSDLGLYVLDATGMSVIGSAGFADQHGIDPGAHPEAADLTFATPGTYYLGVLRFTYTGSEDDPSFYKFTVTGL